MSKGALPDGAIREMMESGFIKGADAQNVNPGSLDLSLSDECYRTNGLYLPRRGERVRDMLNEYGARRHDLSTPFECQVTYMIRLRESLVLPKTVYGYCTPKSSTGRTDVHVRSVGDGVERFDTIAPAGFAGDLWLAVCSKSFPVLLKEGEKMLQARFFTADTRFDETELETAMARHPLIFNPYQSQPISYGEITASDRDGSILLSIDLAGSGIVGYEARRTSKILDFAARDINPDEFFQRVTLSASGRLHLRRDNFYILSTFESVCVPPWLACELVPMDHRTGDLRSHYAGFIDPGWGCGQDGEGLGRQLTLELRPFEDIVLRPGQTVAKATFEKMVRPPDRHYDMLDTSHYRLQAGPGLAKQFAKLR